MKKDLPRDELRGLVDLTLRYVRQGGHALAGDITCKSSRGIDQPAVKKANATDAMREIEQAVLSCAKCPLHAGRTNAVPGEGSTNSGLVFIGEAPGANEDRQGRPFVGRSGELLTKIITRGMEITREEVYITNIVKCRPPGNRNPLPGEIEQCRPYLLKQLEIIRPRVICTLGKFAAQCLLQSKAPISRLRGKQYEYKGIPLVPTFHPAYLLRNYTKEARRQVWDDVRTAVDILKSGA